MISNPGRNPLSRKRVRSKATARNKTPRWVRRELHKIGYDYCAKCWTCVPVDHMTKGDTGRCKACTAYAKKQSVVKRNAGREYLPVDPIYRVAPKLGGLAELRRLMSASGKAQ